MDPKPAQCAVADPRLQSRTGEQWLCAIPSVAPSPLQCKGVSIQIEPFQIPSYAA